jgi:hypothetical protein
MRLYRTSALQSLGLGSDLPLYCQLRVRVAPPPPPELLGSKVPVRAAAAAEISFTDGGSQRPSHGGKLK